MRYVALFMLCVQLFFSGSAFSNEAEKKIVATIKPVHSLATMAAEALKLSPPQLLLEGAADPHHFSLKPSQAKMLEKADLVLFASEQIETFLQKQVEKTPLKYFPPIAFENENATKYSHAWLDMKLTLKMLKSIFFMYRSGKVAGVEYLQTAGSQKLFKIPQPIMDKFIERSTAYLKVFEPYKGHTVWFDSLVGVPFVEQFGVKGGVFKNLLKDSTEKTCLVVTHGHNSKMERTAKALGHKIIHVDLLGVDIPAGSEHYFTLMDKLVAGISACLA